MSTCTVPTQSPSQQKLAVVGSKRAETVSVICDDTQWWIHETVRAQLLGNDGLKLAEWEQQGCLEVVKTGPHREVIKVETGGERFYIKHNKIGSLKPLLQNLIRPAKALQEQRTAQRVRELGIATFETVAWSETRRGGLVRDNHLVSREIPDTQPLDGFLRRDFPNLCDDEQTRVRHGLAVALGTFTAKLHTTGVQHLDFHAGNILLRYRHQKPLGLWLIDLHGVRLRKPLTLKQAKQNLALLHQFFATVTTRTDRFRFFKAYWASRGDSGELKTVVHEVQDFCSRRADRHWRRKDRKWRSGTRHLLKLTAGANRGRGLTTLGREFLNASCRDPEHFFESADAWYKQSAKRRVAAITLVDLPQQPRAFIKCLQVRSLPTRVWQFLGRSSVRRAWENGHALLRRDIATPRPLLYVESAAGLQVRQYLITEAIPNSTTLFDWQQEQFPQLDKQQQPKVLTNVANQLAHQLRRLHACGFEHRDLKSKNILLSQANGEYRTWLLDLEGVRHWPVLPQQRWIQNLSRLNASSLSVSEISLSDRLRFLKTYLGSAYSRSWKQTWQKIEARTRRKIVKNLKNGRPLS